MPLSAHSVLIASHLFSSKVVTVSQSTSRTEATLDCVDRDGQTKSALIIVYSVNRISKQIRQLLVPESHLIRYENAQLVMSVFENRII